MCCVRTTGGFVSLKDRLVWQLQSQGNISVVRSVPYSEPELSSSTSKISLSHRTSPRCASVKDSSRDSSISAIGRHQTACHRPLHSIAYSVRTDNCKPGSVTRALTCFLPPISRKLSLDGGILRLNLRKSPWIKFSSSTSRAWNIPKIPAFGSRGESQVRTIMGWSRLFRTITSTAKGTPGFRDDATGRILV